MNLKWHRKANEEMEKHSTVHKRCKVISVNSEKKIGGYDLVLHNMKATSFLSLVPDMGSKFMDLV